MINTEERLKNLVELLKDIGLDVNWLIAAASLSAQEIAIKRKLNELGATYGDEDFQQLADKLSKILEERDTDVPYILLSIARSYRPIRAKVLHDPFKTRLSSEEANAIFNNTVALVKTLFRKQTELLNIPAFIDSINSSSVDQKIKEFSNFHEEGKKQIFDALMDKIVLLNLREIGAHEQLFDFLKSALKAEVDIALRRELFEIILRRTLTTQVDSLVEERLLSIIAEFTKLSYIRELIKEKKLTNLILTEYEMSGSFAIAGLNAEIIFNLIPILDDKEIGRVVDAALLNNQITYSWKARAFLTKFLSLCRDRIPEEKARTLEKILGE